MIYIDITLCHSQHVTAIAKEQDRKFNDSRIYEIMKCKRKCGNFVKKNLFPTVCHCGKDCLNIIPLRNNTNVECK